LDKGPKLRKMESNGGEDVGGKYGR
jgi:hypothetical protein